MLRGAQIRLSVPPDENTKGGAEVGRSYFRPFRWLPSSVVPESIPRQLGLSLPYHAWKCKDVAHSSLITSVLRLVIQDKLSLAGYWRSTLQSKRKATGKGGPQVETARLEEQEEAEWLSVLSNAWLPTSIATARRLSSPSCNQTRGWLFIACSPNQARIYRTKRKGCGSSVISLCGTHPVSCLSQCLWLSQQAIQESAWPTAERPWHNFSD